MNVDSINNQFTLNRLLAFLSVPIYRTFIWQSIGFFGMFFLRSMGIDHLQNIEFFILFFISISIFIVLLNPEISEHLRVALSLPKIGLIIILYFIIWLLYSSFTPNALILDQFNNIHFAYLSYSYLASKGFDILFQQFAFYLFVFDMLKRKVSLISIQIISSLLLMGSHLIAFKSMPYTVALCFVIGSGAAGFIFPLLYKNKRLGIAFAFCLHWIFYLSMAFVFNLNTGAL